jgi:hypothetical protein
LEKVGKSALLFRKKLDTDSRVLYYLPSEGMKGKEMYSLWLFNNKNMNPKAEEGSDCLCNKTG